LLAEIGNPSLVAGIDPTERGPDWVEFEFEGDPNEVPDLDV